MLVCPECKKRDGMLQTLRTEVEELRQQAEGFIYSLREKDKHIAAKDNQISELKAKLDDMSFNSNI